MNTEERIFYEILREVYESKSRGIKVEVNDIEDAEFMISNWDYVSSNDLKKIIEKTEKCDISFTFGISPRDSERVSFMIDY